MRAALLPVLMGSLGVISLTGCTPAERSCAASADAVVSVGGGGVDADGDSLDDGYEDALARAYLPFLATHPDDACAISGLVFRARPHPDDDALVSITFSRLWSIDCGANGHVGDNEGFGLTIDPAAPPPGGLVSIVAIGHQGTLCERVTACGVCEGLPECQRVSGRPVLFASKDKHAGSVDSAWGCGFGSCLDTCALPLFSTDLPMQNAGEPDAPLLRDLTSDGFITQTNGWDDALLHADPWGDADFGGAGSVRGDLIDEAFVAPACRCDQTR